MKKRVIEFEAYQLLLQLSYVYLTNLVSTDAHTLHKATNGLAHQR
jgi:hypothetical protein